jgi:hypothetical protein
VETIDEVAYGSLGGARAAATADWLLSLQPRGGGELAGGRLGARRDARGLIVATNPIRSAPGAEELGPVSHLL